MKRALAPMLVAALCGAAIAQQRLSINETFRQARCIVHELADDADKATAVKFILHYRDRFFAGREIVDATQLEPAQLRQKLRGGFVLFASAGVERATVWPAATRPLRIEVSRDSLALAGESAPLAAARLICVADNPYGDGQSVVYLGGTNRMVDGIAAVFAGPRSFHLYRDRELVAEGDYNDSFVLAPKRIPLAAAMEDAQELFETLELAHPELLAHMKLEDYRALRRWVVEELARRVETDGLSIRALADVLSRAAAFFGDGHTSINWYKKLSARDAAGTRFPPFAIDFRNGAFVVTAAADASLEERPIEAVDSVPPARFLAPILERCSGEILPFKASRLVNRQAFYWWLTDLLAGRDSLQVTVCGETRALGTIDYERFRALEQRHRQHRNSRRESGVTYHADGRIAHFVYPQFINSPAERERIGGVFEELKKRGVDHLLLDIRGNGGGNSSIGEFLFSYLYDKPFRTFSKMKLKVSRPLLTRYPQYAELEDQIGLLLTRRSPEAAREKPAAFFTGKVTLLIDNGSFSAASGFAAMFRDYGVGEIVGYETGGLPTSFGDVLQLTLTNSQLPYGVSHKQFFGPRPKPGDDEHGVLPDVPVTEELLQGYDGDRVLQFALARAAKSRLTSQPPAGPVRRR